MSGAESREILEACLARAQSLATALTEYTWADRVSSDDLRFVFELLEDVLAIGYSTLADLDREEVEP